MVDAAAADAGTSTAAILPDAGPGVAGVSMRGAWHGRALPVGPPTSDRRKLNRHISVEWPMSAE